MNEFPVNYTCKGQISLADYNKKKTFVLIKKKCKCTICGEESSISIGYDKGSKWMNLCDEHAEKLRKYLKTAAGAA